MYNDTTFGFMRITVSPASITGVFITVDSTSGATGVGDSFTLDLRSNKVSTGTPASGRKAPTSGGKSAAKKSKPKVGKK